MNKDMEGFKKATEKATDTSKVNGLASAFKGLGDIVTGALAAIGMTSSIKSFIDAGNSMVETNNLFAQSLSNVADEYYTTGTAQSDFFRQGVAYQKELSDVLSVNTTELKKFQAMYFNMLNAQGVGEETSYMLSESLTNMAIDLSSLFNTEVSTMAQKLQSGISGQAKALREFGIDVTESSLQTVLDNLGIDATTEQLSYAQKEMLRYMAIMQQVGYAQGDFSRTFNSGANQIKLLKDEVAVLSQEIGIVLSSAFAKAIVWARAFILVMQQVVRAIASFFNINLDNVGVTAKGFGTVGDKIGDVGAGIADATGKAKEFKKQLMGFDEINNITPPAASSGGGGGGGGGVGGLGDIDSALADELEKWKLGLEGLDDEAKRLANNPWFKAISGGAMVLALAGIVSKIKAFAQGLGLIGKGNFLAALGTTLKTKFADILAALIIDFKAAAFEGVGGVAKLVAVWAAAIVTIVEDFKAIIEIIETTSLYMKNGFSFWTSLAWGFEAAAGKIFSDIYSLLGLTSIAEKVREEFGVLTDQQKAFMSWNGKVKESLDNVNKGLVENLKTIDKYEETSNQYIDILKTMTDENGKLKEGYEARADVLLGKMTQATGDEYTRDGELIYRNGELISSYEDLTEKIKTTAEERRNSVELEAEQQRLQAIVQAQKDAYSEMIEAQLNNDTEAQELAQQKIDKLDIMYQQQNDLIKNMAIETSQELDTSMIEQHTIWGTNLVNTFNENKEGWEKALNSITSDNKAYMLAMTQQTGNYTTELKDYWQDLSEESTDDFLTGMDLMSKGNRETVLGMIQLTDNNRPRMISAFERMATESEDKFYERISELNPDTRTAILDAMKNAEGGQYHTQYVKAITKLATSGDTEYVKNLKLDEDTKKEMVDMAKTMNSSDKELSNLAKTLGYDVTSSMNMELHNSYSGVEANARHAQDGFVNEANNGRWKLRQAGTNDANAYNTAYRNTLDINSPSRVMEENAKYTIEGLLRGFRKGEEALSEAGEESAIASMSAMKNVLTSPDYANMFEQFSGGIKVDKNVNSQLNVNYSAITGTINALLNGNNLGSQIASIIEKAISNATVNVEIEAKTDEGVIVKKVIKGVDNITRQTGEFPMLIPIG